MLPSIQVTAGVPSRYKEAQLIVNRAFYAYLSHLEMWKFQVQWMICNNVYADRRIIPLSVGIIIHLDGVDYCIIILYRPFHSL